MVKAQKFAFFVSIVMLLTIMLSIVLFAMPITSAEETTDKYVVFNQQVNNGNFANGTTGFTFSNLTTSVADGVLTCKPSSIPSVDYGSSINVAVNYVKDHKYFLRFDCKTTYSNSYVTFANNNGVYLSQRISSNMTTYSNISTSTKSGTIQSFIYASFVNFSSADTFSISNINVIDLTQMFGVGNEPTIDVCRNLFVSAYYPYNVDGSVISLDGLSNYNRGVLDTIKSYKVNFEGDVFYDSMFALYNFGHPDSICGTQGDGELLAGDIFLSFGGNVLAGTTINLYIDKLSFLSDEGPTRFTISLLTGNSLYSLVNYYAEQTALTYSFVLPFDSTGLVFSTVAKNNSSLSYVSKISGCRLTYKSFNQAILDDSRYNLGYEHGYNDGNTSGYNKGYNKGLAIGSDKQYSFSGLLDAVVQAPITALVGSYDSSGKRVGGLLNFEFLGVNLSFFFTGLLSVTIVIVVIRFILARK